MNASLPAKKFYTEVFNWKFHAGAQAAEYKDLAMFSFPDPGFERLSGGIKKTADPEGKKGGGPIVYLYVDSLEDTAKVRRFVIRHSPFLRLLQTLMSASSVLS